MYKATILFLFCCFFYDVTGQTVEEIQNNELDKFAEIYLLSKTMSPPPDSIIIAILKEKNIRTEDYAAYLKGKIELDKTTPNPKMVQLAESINIINHQIENEKEIRTRQICIQIGMDYERYNFILSKYNSEPLFQNSLHPFFAKLID